jgi:argininosuccinate lyase
LADSPLGAGAGGGPFLTTPPSATPRLLGIPSTFDNSLDAVGSRDHLAEYVYCCAQAVVGLSRFAEEIILWSTAEFGRLRLGDTVTTGSSALPQKRNPDIAELIRGRTARLVGDLASIMTLQKALPLSYNRDLQEDKRIVFDADDVLAASLEAMVEMLTHAEFTATAPEAGTAALDLAESLVGRDIPFREAHAAVGKLLRRLEARGRSLDEASMEDLSAAHPGFDESDLALVDPASSVVRRRSAGGGSPESVRAQIGDLRSIIEQAR